MASQSPGDVALSSPGSQRIQHAPHAVELLVVEHNFRAFAGATSNPLACRILATAGFRIEIMTSAPVDTHQSCTGKPKLGAGYHRAAVKLMPYPACREGDTRERLAREQRRHESFSSSANFHYLAVNIDFATCSKKYLRQKDTWWNRFKVY